MLRLCLLLIIDLSLAQLAYAGDKKLSIIMLEQANIAIEKGEWSKAERYLATLQKDHPKKNIIKNLLAIVYFKQGKIKPAQKLLIQIIESTQSTKVAYNNLKKIYSYSANKSYSEGQKFMTPIALPTLTIDTTNK